ncbi:glycosyltransferase family 2 protein [Flavobacterium hiemivividum]|uniref:Glycosyltransferase family 2 protein n=1 Tax=Flavobacterium hiemivividum TaxID=2541734 RepID=A0A4R5CZI7_9FLAO|nr:glycosyltransferase family A protein [Flavobacterium hiemivividum]TDE04551.1 glycosyltransferase family 2 protein [Flavobacterium hiemivividum]
MKFSIVIPLYNKEKSISRAVNSVLTQSYKDFELIIVNDGSSDNSLTVVENIKDGRIKVVNKTNEGVSSARNVGIDIALFEWILFLDGDDYWKSNHLETILELLQKYPDADMYSTLISENSDKGINYIANSLADGFEGYIDDYFIHAPYGTIFHSSSVCISKEALMNVGGFDTNLKHGEDLDMWFRIMINKKGVVKKTSTVVYDLFGENRAMLSRCKYENHLLSKIDDYRSTEIMHLNQFIDYFILRNSVPYYFSEEKKHIKPNLKKIKKNKKANLFWMYLYSDLFYQINLFSYKFYKYLRAI